jgi:hypothetical protein
MFASSHIADRMEPGERLSEEHLEIGYDTILYAGEGEMTFTMKIIALVYKDVSLPELKVQLRGISEKEARSVLSGYLALKQFELSLWPFWLSAIPQDPNKVRIGLIID